jgi:ribosome-associated toxin RatA of RatAB toxin-antitoxin module
MAKVSMTTKVNVPASQLWDLIGGFNALPAWHPAIEKSEVEEDDSGSIRTLTLAGGGKIVERLESQDDSGHSYSYAILESPLPLTNYHATIRVNEDEGGGCTVEWSSEFNPVGAPENDAMKAVEGIYQAGFDNLRKMFGG